MSVDEQRTELCEEAVALAESRFVPRRYEPNYPYPLLVMFHGRGGDEDQLIRALPALSWRNYVGLGLRGPESLQREGVPTGFGWGSCFARRRSDNRRGGDLAASGNPTETVRRVMAGELIDDEDRIEHGVVQAVRKVRQSLHVHSERIFLMGVGEGAAVAYRLGLSYPDRFAGVVALNGWLPERVLRSPVRLEASRSQRFLVLHGQWNSRPPITQAQRDVATLRAAGLSVAFQSYPCASRLGQPMLADVDTWLIKQCTGQA